MIVAFVAVKLKVFKVSRTDPAFMKWPFERGSSALPPPKYGPILPEFSPKVELYQTKNTEKSLKDLSFHKR